MASDTPTGDDHRRSNRLTAGGRAEDRDLAAGRPVVRPTDVRWLGAALATAALVYATYLLTHDQPAYGAGLYLRMAELISAAGYALPERIPGYTSSGVPFAYPPLSFYVAAVVRDLTGIGPIAYAMYLPGLLTMGYLVPYYFVVRDLLDSSRIAGLASVLFAATPPVLQWHLSGGGMTRSMALLFVLAGTYAGVRLFGYRDRRWLLPATVLFGLTVLTHPVYMVYFGLTYLLLFARFDRTPIGLAAGASVAAGGLLLAAPWWLQVAQAHGADVFLAASGTHSGLAGGGGGGGGGGLGTAAVFALDPHPEDLFYLVAYAGLAYALVRREWFLPAWLAVPAYVIGKPRFQFVAGSILAAMFLVEVVLPGVERVDAPTGRLEAMTDRLEAMTDRLDATPDRLRVARVAVAVLVVLGAVSVGTAYAGGALAQEEGGATMPAFLDDEDRAAMAWAAERSSPSDSFVVLGDAAEWFPLLTDRTILVGPWGVEWTTAEQYKHQLALYKSISDCGNAICVSAHLQASELSPDYVYVPKDTYTVRGHGHHQSDRMRSSMIDSGRFELVYENDGVMIFRVESIPPGPDRSETGPILTP